MSGPQHPAYISLNGRKVDGYTIQVERVVESQDGAETVYGVLVDASGEPRPSIAFSVKAGASGYANPTLVPDILLGFEDAIRRGEKSVHLTY